MSDYQPPPDLPLTVVLPAEKWRVLLGLLAEGHHQLRVVGPLYGEVERQCGVQIARHRGNGASQEEQPHA